MCCMWLAENTGCKNSPKIRHLCTIARLCQAISSQLRHVSAIGKNLLNTDTSSTCPHNMVNFGPLTSEIACGVWGTLANFNGFRILPSLLQQRRSPEVNQTLHDVWLSPGLLHYICIFGISCPLTNFVRCKIHLASKSCILYWQHSRSGRQPNFAAWYKEWKYRTFSEGATYIRLSGHHVWHQPTF